MIFDRFVLATSRAFCLLLLAFTAGVLSPWTDLARAAAPETVAAAIQDEATPALPSEAPGVPEFAYTDIQARARSLADKPYDNTANAVPAYLQNLDVDKWRSLKIKPEYILWKNEGLPFSISLFHPGYVFNRSARINVVTDGQVAPIPFSVDMFEYGDDALARQVRDAATGFAGFQLLTPSESKESPYGRNSENSLVGFMGASNFLFKGRNSRMGTFSRAVAMNTALPSGELFPYFREFWLVKPAPDATAFTLYALMDSPCLTGAYRMEITPGTSAVMKVDATLYQRPAAGCPEKLGLAPLASMFLHSETVPAKENDARPEVHNADCLLFVADADLWACRPLSNNERLITSVFPMNNPKGFGLMQRDNEFEHYRDAAARFDRRVSVWVEPAGDWGKGRLELLEIPGTRDFHNNILAFWVPENGLAANDGQGDTPTAPAKTPADMGREISYVMYWMPPGATPHGLGKAVSTRILRSPENGEVAFVVDFEGGLLDDLGPETGLTSVVELPEQVTLMEKMLDRHPETPGWRLVMKVRLPQNGMLQRLLAARDGPTGLRFKAHLKKGENITDPLTETWIYDLVP